MAEARKRRYLGECCYWRSRDGSFTTPCLVCGKPSDDHDDGEHWHDSIGRCARFLGLLNKQPQLIQRGREDFHKEGDTQ